MIASAVEIMPSCRVGRQDAEVGLGACDFLGEHHRRFPALCRAVQKMSFFQLISMALAFAKLPAIALEREVTGQRQPATAIGSLWWRPRSTAKNTHAVAAKTPFARGQPH